MAVPRLDRFHTVLPAAIVLNAQEGRFAMRETCTLRAKFQIADRHFIRNDYSRYACPEM